VKREFIAASRAWLPIALCAAGGLAVAIHLMPMFLVAALPSLNITTANAVVMLATASALLAASKALEYQP